LGSESVSRTIFSSNLRFILVAHDFVLGDLLIGGVGRRRRRRRSKIRGRRGGGGEEEFLWQALEV
jgi:hypothetical protein